MGKGNTKSSGPKRSQPEGKSQGSSSSGKGKVSDALRQAVEALGGEEGDYDLIAGVDDEEGEEDVLEKSGSKVDEVGPSSPGN